MQTIIDSSTLIVRTPETCGDRPMIAGIRITVQFIVNQIRLYLDEDTIKAALIQALRNADLDMAIAAIAPLPLACLN